MSAAATAAGYLYASGRLRGRGAKTGEHEQPGQEPRQEKKTPQPPRAVRVAVYERPQPAVPREKPKRTPKIEYRQRRWRPGEEPR